MFANIHESDSFLRITSRKRDGRRRYAKFKGITELPPKNVTRQPPPSGATFFAWFRKGERETRVTGDDAQETMGRVKKEVLRKGYARFPLPAFLCALIFIKRETSGYEAGYKT